MRLDLPWHSSPGSVWLTVLSCWLWGPFCLQAGEFGVRDAAVLCELAEQRLRHASHGAGPRGLPGGSKVLDDHRQNGGERHLYDLWGDPCFCCGFFDKAGSGESLLDLIGGCSGGLTGAPIGDVLGHSVVLEGVKDALNAFGMLSEGFDEASSYLGLVGSGRCSGLSGERLNHVHNSHGVHLEPPYEACFLGNADWGSKFSTIS